MSRHKFATAEARAKPLDSQALNMLALAYVGRYATTRSKLRAYLQRKTSSRGWQGDDPPPIDAIVERCAELGYVNDAGFAAARGAALTRRGFGERRIAAALQASGIDQETASPVRAAAREDALQAALIFARRKRIGPFALAEPTFEKQRKDLAALLRAGHAPDLARRIAYASPGADIDES